MNIETRTLMDSELGLEDRLGCTENGLPVMPKSKESVILAHEAWLDSGSLACTVSGRERPIRYNISPEFRKLRNASFCPGQKVARRMGFVEKSTSYGRQFWSEPSDNTGHCKMQLFYHSAKMQYSSHWHLHLMWGGAVADLDLNGRVIGWHDDPYYKGVGVKDPNSTYHQTSRHIPAK